MSTELEELLSRIKKNKEASSVPSHTNSIEEFIELYNIEQGVDRIPNFVLYYMYENYTSSYLKHSRIEFFRQFSKLFKSKRNGNQRFYLVNMETIKFKEDYTELYVKAKYEKTKEYLRKAERNLGKPL